MKKTFATIVTLFAFFNQVLAENTAVTGDDFFRSIGKIYVVVGVIAIIFIGIIIFLANIDRKLTKLHDQIKNE